MKTLHLNTYLHLIEALLQCAKGEEWLLLTQHQELIDAELIGVMAQVTQQLNAEGDLPAAKFLHYWAEQLTSFLQQNSPTATFAESRSPSYLSLIQTIFGSEPGDEVAILNQHPDLMDAELVNGHVKCSINPAVEIVKQPLPELVNQSTASPKLSSYLEELLANISSRLEKLETSIDKHQHRSNPLWYMSILEQADAQGWIVSSDEIEQLIGTKPHCAPDSNSFVRGCWKFEKAGKVGMQSSWRVTKEILTPSIGGVGLPSGIVFTPTEAALRDQTPQPGGKLDLDLSSPWAEK